MALPKQLAQPVDKRFDPFAELDENIAINNEVHLIPSLSPYRVRLNEVPAQESPSTVAIPGYTEVTVNPAPGEFRVDYKYKTGYILFNSADAGKVVSVSYNATGTPVAAYITNAIRDLSGIMQGAWRGQDWFTHFGTSWSDSDVPGGPGWTVLGTVYGEYPFFSASSISHKQHVGVVAGTPNMAWYAKANQVRVAGRQNSVGFFRWRISTEGTVLGSLAGIGYFRHSPISSTATQADAAYVARGNTPGTIKFITRSGANTQTTDNLPTAGGVNTWSIHGIELAPSYSKLWMVNTFGEWILQAQHTVNIPSTLEMSLFFYSHDNRVFLDFAGELTLDYQESDT